MRVVILADFAEPKGGAERVAIESALALGARGVPVTYIHATAGSPDERLELAGIKRICLGLPGIWDLPAARAAPAGIWRRASASRLRIALASFSPADTVVHLHQWTKALSPSIFPVLFGAAHPLVVTLHDYFLSCPNGVYYRFDQEEPCSLVPLSGNCLRAPCDPRSRAHKAVRVLRSLATRGVLAGRSFDVVHVSERGRATIGPFLPPGLRQHRIDNPVEAKRREPISPSGDAALAYVGRLTFEKGADLVAEAAKLAGERVLFIGDGPAAAAIRRANPAAELLGWRSRAEVECLLRSRVKALVAPSRWYETGPLTIYEAMAAGLPAIVSSRAGAAEKVVDGVTGLVVEPTTRALVEAFRRLAEPSLAGAMGRAAYAAYWRAPLSPETHAERLIEMYSGLLSPRG